MRDRFKRPGNTSSDTWSGMRSGMVTVLDTSRIGPGMRVCFVCVRSMCLLIKCFMLSVCLVSVYIALYAILCVLCVCIAELCCCAGDHSMATLNATAVLQSGVQLLLGFSLRGCLLGAKLGA